MSRQETGKSAKRADSETRSPDRGSQDPRGPEQKSKQKQHLSRQKQPDPRLSEPVDEDTDPLTAEKPQSRRRLRRKATSKSSRQRSAKAKRSTSRNFRRSHSKGRAPEDDSSSAELSSEAAAESGEPAEEERPAKYLRINRNRARKSKGNNMDIELPVRISELPEDADSQTGPDASNRMDEEVRPAPAPQNKMDVERPAKRGKKSARRRRPEARTLSPKPEKKAGSRKKHGGSQNFNVLEKIEALRREKHRMASGDKFATALNSLSENFTPPEIKCRDKEKKVIRDFIESGLRNLGNSQTLYISGVPGLGKTACVLEIIRDLKQQRADFSFFLLNGLKCKKALDVYSDLYAYIFDRRPSAEVACKELDKFFMTGELPGEHRDLNEARPEIRNTKVILLDELDCLLTKNQSILYNLFEWPQRKKANLIVLSVANTLDLPETFMARISSRIGNARLVFTPYSSAEIKEIITQRVREVDIFDEAALNFISKKVAVISSDIRKTLSICRMAIERFLEECAKAGPRAPEEASKITLSLVAKVFEGTYNTSPMNDFVASCNRVYRAFLTEMYLELRQSENKSAQFSKVFNRYNNSTMASTDKVSAHDMMQIVKRLKLRGIVSVKYRSASEIVELHYLSNLDELAFSLKDDPYFSKKVET